MLLRGTLITFTYYALTRFFNKKISAFSFIIFTRIKMDTNVHLYKQFIFVYFDDLFENNLSILFVLIFENVLELLFSIAVLLAIKSFL